VLHDSRGPLVRRAFVRQNRVRDFCRPRRCYDTVRFPCFGPCMGLLDSCSPPRARHSGDHLGRSARPLSESMWQRHPADELAAGRSRSWRAGWPQVLRRHHEPVTPPAVDLGGTPLRRRVWAGADLIFPPPHGEHMRARPPSGEPPHRKKRESCAAVAQGCGANPIAHGIPCTRVIGRTALRATAGVLEAQKSVAGARSCGRHGTWSPA